jgi:hypothetical protein
MKLIKLLLTLLLFVNQSVWAELTPVGEFNSRTYFIELESIKKDGNFRMVWIIANLPSPGKHGELSWRNKYEYDCYEERRRERSWSVHSEPLGQGAIIRANANPPSLWSPVRSDSKNEVNKKVLKIVCAK